MEAAAPDHRDSCTPLYLLLDDLPVAALVSGYAMQRAGEIGRMPIASYTYNTDQCAGWRAGGTLMLVLADKGAVPMTIGPPAPDLQPPGDDLAWHAHPSSHPGACGAAAGSTCSTAATATPCSRSTRCSATPTWVARGSRRSCTSTPSPDRSTVTRSPWSSAHARPRVLPYVECPDAAASADRLAGMSVADLRRRVRQELTGISTCTHLNDLLRSLTDIASLAAAMRAEGDS